MVGRINHKGINRKGGATEQQLIDIFDNIKIFAERGIQSIISNMPDPGGSPGRPRGRSRRRSRSTGGPRATSRRRSRSTGGPRATSRRRSRSTGGPRATSRRRSMLSTGPIPGPSMSGESKTFSISTSKSRPVRYGLNNAVKIGRFTVEDMDTLTPVSPVTGSPVTGSPVTGSPVT